MHSIFHDINNQISGNIDEYNRLNNLSNDVHFFLEPAITIRGGWKYVKLQIQASTASYFNNPDLHFETTILPSAYILPFQRVTGKDARKE